MQNAALLDTTIVLLYTLQALFLAPLLLGLPLSPTVILGGFVAHKVALLGLVVLTFGNDVEVPYSAGVPAGSGSRGL